MPQKLRIGLIGAGGIMRGCHVPGWKEVPDIELAAVCDINREAATRLAAEHGIPRVCTDFREVMKIKDIDAVDICAPNMVHTPATLAALAAGKHVICEKPLAVTVKEVKQMIAAAAKARKMLMTAQHQRFGGPAVALGNYVKAHPLGDVYHARVHATRRDLLPVNPGFIDPRLSGGGPCMDIGVHALDTAMWLMGFPTPVRVTGKTAVNFARGHDIPGAWGDWDRTLFGVEDFACGFVHFRNGATMVVETSWLQHQHEREDMSFRLFGTKGSVSWPSAHVAGVANGVLFDSTLVVPSVRAPHTEEIKAFAAAIRGNRPSPVPPSETIKVIAILEGIYRSCKKGGREVSVAL